MVGFQVVEIHEHVPVYKGAREVFIADYVQEQGQWQAVYPLISHSSAETDFARAPARVHVLVQVLGLHHDLQGLLVRVAVFGGQLAEFVNVPGNPQIFHNIYIQMKFTHNAVTSITVEKVENITTSMTRAGLGDDTYRRQREK